MDNSLAFFKIPLFLFEYVTCLLPVLSSRLIFNLTLPILLKKNLTASKPHEQKHTKGWVFISNSTHFVLYVTQRFKKTCSFNELFSKWSCRRKKTTKSLNMETSKLGHRVSLSLENKIHCNGRFKKGILQQRQRKKKELWRTNVKKKALKEIVPRKKKKKKSWIREKKEV